MCARETIGALDGITSSMKTCFGPNGLHGLLQRDGGRAKLIQTGAEAFCLQNDPVTRFISQAVGHCHHSTGDGSKRTVLMLTSLLRECERMTSGTCRSPIELANAFCCLQASFIKTIIPKLITNGSKIFCVLTLVDAEVPVKLQLEKILNTSFGSGYSYSVRKRLKDLLMEYFFPNDQQPWTVHRLRELISQCQRWLDVHIICVDGVSVSRSQLYPGFLMECDLVDHSLLDSLAKLSKFKVLLLYSDLTLPLDDATLHVASRGHLVEAVECLTAHTTRAVEWMTLNNARLILSARKLSPGTVRLLSQHSIAAIQVVEKDILLAISEYCGTLPFLHTSHLVSSLDAHTASYPGLPVFFSACEKITQNTDGCDMLKADCTSLKCINVGRRRLVHLQFSTCNCSAESSPHSEHMQSILLCAPTLSYCRQLAEMVANSLKLVRLWMEPVLVNGETRLVSVCGGGAWEMALAKLMEEQIQANTIHKETVMWTAIKALQKVLLEIVQSLVLSVSSLSSGREVTKAVLLSKISHTPPVMVSAIDGSLIEVGEADLWPAVEPLALQQEVLLSTLSVVCQLLKIDGLVSVKRLAKEDRNSDSDSDE